MSKRWLKWVVRGVLAGVVLVLVLGVIFFLALDPLLRLLIEHNVRAQTGLTAKIGKFHLGLTEPVIEIKDLRLYNPKGFDHTPFLTIPEIYVAYDRAALRRNEIHITDLRFDLGELDIVKSPDGQTNLFALGVALPTAKTAATNASPLADFKQQTRLQFTGIDRLNVSVGQFKYVDLQDAGNNQTQNIALNNIVISNVTSVADLAGLGLVVGLRSGDFFKPLVAPDASKDAASGKDLLKLLGH